MSNVFDGFPIEVIPIGLIEFRLHNIDPSCIGKISTRDEPAELISHDGRYFVHDGRHRILTDLWTGYTYIYARVWIA